MGNMSAKLFRESHREIRLRPFRPGLNEAEEVRPLSLTVALEKIINVKDSVAQHLHEERIASPSSTFS
jgi:hypothetical protein